MHCQVGAPVADRREDPARGRLRRVERRRRDPRLDGRTLTVRSLDDHRAAALALAAPLPAVERVARRRRRAGPGRRPADRGATCRAGTTRRWTGTRSGTPTSSALPVTLRVVADLPAGSADEPVVGRRHGRAHHDRARRCRAGADTVVPVELTDAGTVTVTVRDAPDAGRARPARGRGRRPRRRRRRGRHAARTRRHRRGRVASAAPTRPGPPPAARRGRLDRRRAGAARDAAAPRPAPRLELVAARRRRPRGGRRGRAARPGARRRRTRCATCCSASTTSTRSSPPAASASAPTTWSRPRSSTSRTSSSSPVAVQPGKPQGLGRLPGGTPIVTLPGNPVSSFASFEMFVRPALLRMRGLADVERPTVTRRRRRRLDHPARTRPAHAGALGRPRPRRPCHRRAAPARTSSPASPWPRGSPSSPPRSTTSPPATASPS